MSNSGERLLRPGFGLPINYYEGRGELLRQGGPHAVYDYGWMSKCVLVRERRLCEAIDRLTDKPDWRRKVFDKKITAKWRAEVVNPRTDRDSFSHQMFDFCLAELQDKAKQHVDTGILSLYEVGPVVTKSDSIVSERVRALLADTTSELLENVPDRLKDWHPDSGEQVLDLVHPSLFPVIYGRSKILPTTTIGIDDCLQASGSGETATPPSNHSGDGVGTFEHKSDLWSPKFQWLPADVQFHQTGVKFSSYINNLHPINHRSLYPIIEEVLGHAVSLWDVMFGRLTDSLDNHLRFPDRSAEYEHFKGTGVEVLRAMRHEERVRQAGETTDEAVDESEAEASPPPMENRYDSNDLLIEEDDDMEFWEHDWSSDHEQDWPFRRRKLIQPEPMSYEKYKAELPARQYPLLKEAYAGEGLQVIVKLANIHLTPDNPDYYGGSWHVEGMLNEMICATALYYYDCENITDSHLAFRQTVDPDELMHIAPQGDYGGLEKLYDIEQDGPNLQDVGKILTRQGRLLAFPNMVQHQVQPFSLKDQTKPGHRKILAFFLVNPKARILSTANVPPQRKDWWEEELHKAGTLDFMPSELQKHIVGDVDEFPYSLEEAKNFRLELMNERRDYTEYVDNNVIAERGFNFCEH